MSGVMNNMMKRPTISKPIGPKNTISNIQIGGTNTIIQK